MLWNPFSQAGFHLIALSDFRDPPLVAISLWYTSDSRLGLT